jgi:hypothetical protein
MYIYRLFSLLNTCPFCSLNNTGFHVGTPWGVTTCSGFDHPPPSPPSPSGVDAPELLHGDGVWQVSYNNNDKNDNNDYNKHAHSGQLNSFTHLRALLVLHDHAMVGLLGLLRLLGLFGLFIALFKPR